LNNPVQLLIAVTLRIGILLIDPKTTMSFSVCLRKQTQLKRRLICHKRADYSRTTPWLDRFWSEKS
jgi:hypothetical protein